MPKFTFVGPIGNGARHLKQSLGAPSRRPSLAASFASKQGFGANEAAPNAPSDTYVGSTERLSVTLTSKGPPKGAIECTGR